MREAIAIVDRLVLAATTLATSALTTGVLAAVVLTTAATGGQLQSSAPTSVAPSATAAPAFAHAIRSATKAFDRADLPACDRTKHVAESFFQPLPDDVPRSLELHHLDDLGFVDLDCDGVIDHMFRHVGVDGPELTVLSYLHRERFYDYRIPLAPHRACEARVAIDNTAVVIVIAQMTGPTCTVVDFVEHYAIREDRLYRDGRFLRRGT